jgi:hypothetical protein
LEIQGLVSGRDAGVADEHLLDGTLEECGAIRIKTHDARLVTRPRLKDELRDCDLKQVGGVRRGGAACLKNGRL